MVLLVVIPHSRLVGYRRSGGSTSQYYNLDENITTFQPLSVFLCLGQITSVFGFIEELSRAKNKKNNKPNSGPWPCVGRSSVPGKARTRIAPWSLVAATFSWLSMQMMEGTVHLDRDIEIVLKEIILFMGF